MSEAPPTVAAMEPRTDAALGRVNTAAELTYLRAGADAPWERPHCDGVDVTDRPDLQTAYQRQRRADYDARVQGYRERGLV